MQSPRTLRKIANDPFVYLLFLLALALFSAAYQFSVPFSFTAAGPFASLFLHGVYDKEFDKVVRFRWTDGNARVLIRGWGAGHEANLHLRLTRWQPNDRISDLVVYVDDVELAEPQASGQGWQEYSLPITGPEYLASDDLRIRLESDTFSPKAEIPGSADKRFLGVQLDRIELFPLVKEGGSWRQVDYPVWDPLVLPPMGVVLPLAGSVLVLYLGLVLFWVPRRAAFAVGVAAALGGAAILVFARPFLPIFATQTLIVLAVSVAAGLGIRAILPRFMAWGGVRAPAAEMNLLALIFALGFLVKIAFLFYPQTISFDLLYHVHRVQFILEGKFFWSIPSAFNEFGGQAVPYLPSFYIFLAPFASLIPPETLVRLSGVLLDGVTVFFVYYLLKKHFDDGRAGLFAAWIYTVAPLGFIALSWGIYANVYGQFLTLLLVVALVESFDSLARPRAFVVITLLFSLVLLSHTSVFASIVPLFAIWGLLVFLLGRIWKQPAFWAFAGTIVVASVIALGLYYSGVVGLVTQSTLAIAETAGDPVTRNVGDRSLDFLTLLQPARTSFTAVPLYVYAAMAFGFLLLTYRAWRSPDRGRFLLTTMLAAWLGALAILMFVRAEFGFSSRYVNFAMPAISICAGAALSWIYNQRLVGRLVALGAATVLAAQGAYQWFELAIYYYH